MMRRAAALAALSLLVLIAAACDSLPGLRVLQGADEPQTIADAAVEAGDLVMADKASGSDPAVLIAGERIEVASNGTLDVVEMRAYPEQDTFYIDMLYRTPVSDEMAMTPQGNIAQLDSIRRSFELAWLGGMPFSEDMTNLRVSLMLPQRMNTIDNGASLVGFVFAEGMIERAAAQAYLEGDRSLERFLDLVVDGTLLYGEPEAPVFYPRTPNHPVYMLLQEL